MIGALLALGLFVLPAFSQSPGAGEKTLELNEWSKCGFVSRFSPNKINPECFQNLNNAILDQDLSILRRNGYAPYNPTACTGSQPVRGLWRFDATDGSQYLIVQSSASMFYSKGDGSCTAITGLNGGLSTTAQMSCVQGIGFLWCSNGTNSVFKTNATSTAAISGAPLGKYIGFFRNRIVISGVSANVTSIYLSGELNGEDWTLPGVTYSTSPAIIKINGVNDGLGVKCLMGEFQNGYYLGRDYDTWTLAGYDNRDFTLRQVDSHIGCMDNNSPRLVNNQLIWLSHRGVEGLTGTQIQWLSYPISPTIETIINAAGNSQAQTITTQADWQLGNLTASGPGAPISATIAPGSIVPSSFSVSESASSQWDLGTYSFTNSNAGYIAISTALANSGFESGSFTPSWAPIGAVSVSFGGNPCFGSYKVTITTANWGSSGFFQALNSADSSVVISTPFSTPSIVTGCLILPLDVSTITATSIKLRVINSDGSHSITSDAILKSSDVFALSFKRVSGNSLNFDFPEPLYHSSGTFRSKTFDTALSTPTWGPFSATGTVTTLVSAALANRLVYTTEVSSSATGTFVSATETDTSKISNSALRFIRYVLTMWAGGNTSPPFYGESSPQVSGVGLSASTTGYYIAPCIQTGGATSWGSLDVNAVNNGGTLVFSASTGTTCGAVTSINANWTTQTANSVITVPTTTVLGLRALFSITSGTQAPLINDITANWNAGAARPVVASEQYRNRYYLFYTTSSAIGAANDHAIVFDQNSHWQLYDDIPAASSVLYLNSLYIGDSSSTGKVYLFDSGNDDNGNSYTFSFTTPDMDGGDPIAPKQFSRAYLTLQSPSAITNNSTLDCSYTLNGSSAAYSLGTVSLSESPQTGYFVAKLPFPAGQPNTGQWVNLTCSNTGTAGPLRVYSIRLVYTPIAWP